MNFGHFLFSLSIILFCMNFGFSYINVSDCTSISNAFLTGETEVRLNDSISNHVGDCFLISADNFVFDCQNFSNYIDGTGSGSGIDMTSSSPINVTVKNCNITDFTVGVRLGLVTDSSFLNLRTVNGGSGIRLDSSHRNLFSNIVTYDHTYNGIYVRVSDNNIFEYINSTNNNVGINFESNNDNNIVRYSYILDNNWVIIIDDTPPNTNNTFLGNSLDNSSKIATDSWANNAPTYFIDNTYTSYYGCFSYPDICEVSSLSASSSSSFLFDFGSIWLSIIIVFVSLLL